MPFHPFRLLGLLVAVLLPACGLASQDRPEVVEFFPPNGAVLDDAIQEIRLTYDEPVRLLNTDDIRVLLDDDTFFPIEVVTRRSDPNSIFLRPLYGAYFPLDTPMRPEVLQGAVVNGDDHYADARYSVRFTNGLEPTIPVASPGLVTMLDPDTFASTGTAAMPAGREPVGLVSTVLGTDRRVWVQLDTGAGAGDALAWFDPYAPGPTTVVSLTTSAGGDLEADVPALVPSADGRLLYAAYRDTITGGVRVSRVDVKTGTETGSIELASITASPTTVPEGIAFVDFGSFLVVSGDNGAMGWLAFIDPETFTEVDRDGVTGGVQGLVLPAGGGPLAGHSSIVFNADPGGTSVTSVSVETLGTTVLPGAGAGFTVGMECNLDRENLYQAIAGFAGTDAVGQRGNADNYGLLAPLTWSDDVGGVSQGATDSIAIVGYVGSPRFLLLLDSAMGVLATTFTRAPTAVASQDDLDGVTPGIQAINIDAIVPGAFAAGRTYGAFAP